MSLSRKVKSNEIFMGKLSHDADLLGELNEICRDKKIHLGRIEAIGAVKKACIGFYNQTNQKYQIETISQPLEITSLIGNISIKDTQPMVHAHITLSDSKGNTYGGHLAPGTIVFACEWIIEVYEGPKFVRKLDQITGLPLWDENA